VPGQNGLWQSRTPLPATRSEVSTAVSLHGKLYVIGGFATNGPVGNVLEYDPIADTWKTLSYLPTPRGALGVATVGNKIYAIGGVTGSGGNNIAALEVYDPSGITWEIKAPLTTRRDHLAVGEVSDRIYAIGGRLGFNFASNLNINEFYNPQTYTWSSGVPMPTVRSGIAGAVIQGKIHVFGGESPSSTYADNEVYDPVAGSWQKYAPMPTARHGLGAAVVGEVVYVMGGGVSPGSSDCTDNEAFKLS